MITSTFIDPTTEAHTIGDDWATPTKLRPLFYDDPAVVWLEAHGQSHGFIPQQPRYGMTSILAQKGRQFEAEWIRRVAPEAVQVCRSGAEGRLAARVRATIDLMAQGVPVIAQAALWFPAERLYGVPDLLVLASWARTRLPALAQHLGDDEHYIVLDLKCTRKIEEKKLDLAYYQAQVRLYSHMLGYIQQATPAHAFIVTCDRLDNPLPVPVMSGHGLDAELAKRCEQYRQIVCQGQQLRPWEHPEVAPNYSHSDELWADAKAEIMERVVGGAVEQMWNIGPAARQKLHAAGITTLDTLLATNPDRLPKGVLRQREAMLAIMDANRSGTPYRAIQATPPTHAVELFVDCEFLSSINIDYEREWPDFCGTPMIFMIGVGWIENGEWRYRDFIATEESHAAEWAMLEEFQAFLLGLTHGAMDTCALFHWSHAERTQMCSAADRHELDAAHMLRGLPWFDLEAHFRGHACAVPGAWGYGLKPVAKALAALDASYDPQWPAGLSDGGMAQVMGWQAYQCPRPLETAEMDELRAYLEADCRATHQIARWLRS